MGKIVSIFGFLIWIGCGSLSVHAQNCSVARECSDYDNECKFAHAGYDACCYMGDQAPCSTCITCLPTGTKCCGFGSCLAGQTCCTDGPCISKPLCEQDEPNCYLKGYCCPEGKTCCKGKCCGAGEFCCGNECLPNGSICGACSPGGPRCGNYCLPDDYQCCKGASSDGDMPFPKNTKCCYSPATGLGYACPLGTYCGMECDPKKTVGCYKDKKGTVSVPGIDFKPPTPPSLAAAKGGRGTPGLEPIRGRTLRIHKNK